MRNEKFIIYPTECYKMSYDRALTPMLIVVNVQFAYFDYPAGDSRQVFFINPVSRDWHRAWYALPLREILIQRSANAFVGLSSFCFFLFYS